MTNPLAALTRRKALAAAAAAAIVAAPASAQMADHEKALYDAAIANDETEITWYTAHTGGETAQAVGRRFEELFPDISVNVVRTTAQVAFQRVSQELMADALQVDVLSSTDVGHYATLKEQGELMPFRPQNVDGMFETFQGLDPDDQFHVTSAGLVVITYNTEMVPEGEVPTSWLDLVDPKWKDAVSVGHPGFSGYVGTWVLLMEQQFGWEYFEKLAENNPQIGRSINDTVTMLNGKERSIAAGPSATTLLSASKGNPLALSYPEEGSLLMISPSGIMAKTDNPNAAKLFMEFLTSKAHGDIMTGYFSESLRPDVEPPKGAKPLGDIKLLRPENIEEGIPMVIEKWRDTFGI